MLAMRLIGELQIVLQVIQETHGIQMESLCSGYGFVIERKEVVSPLLLPMSSSTSNSDKTWGLSKVTQLRTGYDSHSSLEVVSKRYRIYLFFPDIRSMVDLGPSHTSSRPLCGLGERSRNPHRGKRSKLGRATSLSIWTGYLFKLPLSLVFLSSDQKLSQQLCPIISLSFFILSKQRR